MSPVICFIISSQIFLDGLLLEGSYFPGGGGVLGLIFAEYVPLASQILYPIIVYSVANYRPHLSHFWANVHV